MATSSSRMFKGRIRFFSHTATACIEPGSDYLSNLPYELAQKIIYEIHDPVDHISLALVSRIFYHYVMESLRKIPMELSRENLSYVTEIRCLLTKRNVFTESDLLKISVIIDRLPSDGRRSFLLDFVRLAGGFHSENRLRKKDAFKTLFFKSTAKIPKKRTQNDLVAQKENYFRCAIIMLCAASILLLILSPYFKIFSSGAFLTFAVLVFCSMILLLLDMPTRLAYAYFTDVLLCTEITSVNDLGSGCRDFFRVRFPDYEETDQPLYHMISNHIKANLHTLLFDYKEQQAPELLLNTSLTAELAICIEDNVLSITQADSDNDELVQYSLFDENSDSEEYSESHALMN